MAIEAAIDPTPLDSTIKPTIPLNETSRPTPIEYIPQVHNSLIERFIGNIPDNSMYALTPRQQRSLRSVFRWGGFWQGYFTRKFETALTINDSDLHRKLVAKVHEKTTKQGQPLNIQLPAVVFMSEHPNLFVVGHELEHVIQQHNPQEDMTYDEREAEAYLVAMGLYKYLYPKGGFYDFIRVSDEHYTTKSDTSISNSLAESPEYKIIVELWNNFGQALKARNLTDSMRSLPDQFASIKKDILQNNGRTSQTSQTMSPKIAA